MTKLSSIIDKEKVHFNPLAIFKKNQKVIFINMDIESPR